MGRTDRHVADDVRRNMEGLMKRFACLLVVWLLAVLVVTPGCDMPGEPCSLFNTSALCVSYGSMCGAGGDDGAGGDYGAGGDGAGGDYGYGGSDVGNGVGGSDVGGVGAGPASTADVGGVGAGPTSTADVGGVGAGNPRSVPHRPRRVRRRGHHRGGI